MSPPPCCARPCAPATTGERIDASFGDIPFSGDLAWSTFGAPGTRFITVGNAQDGSQSLKMFGPFDVLAVGNRMGSTDIVDQQGGRGNSENRVTLKATSESGRDIKGMPQLMNFLTTSKFKPLRLKIHAANPDSR